MKLDSELAEFLSGPVLLVLCAADAARRPSIARGMGAIVCGPNEVDVTISRWQWPDAVRNIAVSGRLALTASRASDYVTYQLKGSATVREADGEEIERARRYWASAAEALGRENVPPYITGQWAPDRDMVTASLRVAELYVQTPGPQAGTAL